MLCWQDKPLFHNASAGVIIGNQTLVLQNITRHRAGLYTCVASNSEGDGVSNPLNLDVKCEYSLSHLLALTLSTIFAKSAFSKRNNVTDIVLWSLPGVCTLQMFSFVLETRLGLHFSPTFLLCPFFVSNCPNRVFSRIYAIFTIFCYFLISYFSDTQSQNLPMEREFR